MSLKSVSRKILNFINWQKLFQLLCILIIIGLTIAVFENRRLIYEKWAPHLPSSSVYPSDFKLSKHSMAEIDKAVSKSELLVGLQITIVNFDKNTRLIVYSSMDDEILKSAYKTFVEKSVGEIPLFNSDPANNVRMSQLINGEFICTPLKDTIIYKLVKETEQSVEYICANGIPPYYGKFTGIVTLYLRRKPSSAEMDQFRTMSKELSLSVFDRDFR